MENVNKISKTNLLALGAVKYRVTITSEETGEVVYSHPSIGGVFCSVEEMKVLKDEGAAEGNQQHFLWGKPVAVIHASLMLNQEVEKQVKGNPAFVRSVQQAFNE